MKKTAIAIAVALANFVSVAQAAPKNNTWYTCGKLGWSQFHKTDWYYNAVNRNVHAYGSPLGAGVFGGYQINPYIGLEMGYDWLGRIPYKGDTVNAAFQAQGVQLTTKLDYPVTDNLDAYTRLGGIVWHADSSTSITGDHHDTGVSPVLAGGLEWSMAHNIATRLEYQWINNIGDINTVGVRPNNSMLSVGVSYQLGHKHKEIIPLVTPVPAVTSETENKHFTLKSNVLFNFNEVTMKPESHQALDQICTQLSNLNPKDYSIAVLGFTDRIGSSAYNYFLSEKRAQAVVNYLNFKGIPSTKVFARGMGGSNSVTGNTCNNIKVRTTLINCLAPDRRAEIEVKGIKNNVKSVVTHPAATA